MDTLNENYIHLKYFSLAFRNILLRSWKWLKISISIRRKKNEEQSGEKSECKTNCSQYCEVVPTEKSGNEKLRDGNMFRIAGSDQMMRDQDWKSHWRQWQPPPDCSSTWILQEDQSSPSQPSSSEHMCWCTPPEEQHSHEGCWDQWMQLQCWCQHHAEPSSSREEQGHTHCCRGRCLGCCCWCQETGGYHLSQCTLKYLFPG